MFQVCIGAHIGRVLATELQADGKEAPCGGSLNRCPAGHRTGEGNVLHFAVDDQLFRIPVIEMQILEYPFRQPRFRKRRDHTFGTQGRLRGVFQQHTIAGKQRRHHRIDRRQVGVIPGSDHKCDPQGYPADKARKPGLALQ